MSSPKKPNRTAKDVVETGTVYTIETVERITHISRDRIILYYEHGLVTPLQAPDREHLVFDDAAIHTLRKIAFLISEYEMNHKGLRALFELMNEVEKLRREVRFLRER